MKNEAKMRRLVVLKVALASRVSTDVLISLCPQASTKLLYAKIDGFISPADGAYWHLCRPWIKPESSFPSKNQEEHSRGSSFARDTGFRWKHDDPEEGSVSSCAQHVLARGHLSGQRWPGTWQSWKEGLQSIPQDPAHQVFQVENSCCPSAGCL